MGSIGANKNSPVSVQESLAGKSITELDRYINPTATGVTSWKQAKENIRKDFGLDFATDAQIDAIRDVFKGIQEHDHGYDENKTPYNIASIRIQRVLEQTPEELARNKELFGRTYENKDIQISITTVPNTESAYLRMTDEKERYAMVGKNGGFFTYNDNGKRKTVKSFDMMYGNRRGLGS